jgi:hypothetical protein
VWCETRKYDKGSWGKRRGEKRKGMGWRIEGDERRGKKNKVVLITI